jgi:hypothetical protein
VRIKHPGHTYGGFVPAISKRGMTNRNRVGSMGRGRCSSSSLISMGARIGASAGIMSPLSTVVAPTISLHQVLGSLGPLNTLIPNSGSMEIVGALNHLMPWGRKILVQLTMASAGTMAEQDGTHV